MRFHLAIAIAVLVLLTYAKISTAEEVVGVSTSCPPEIAQADPLRIVVKIENQTADEIRVSHVPRVFDQSHKVPQTQPAKQPTTKEGTFVVGIEIPTAKPKSINEGGSVDHRPDSPMVVPQKGTRYLQIQLSSRDLAPGRNTVLCWLTNGEQRFDASPLTVFVNERR